MWSTTNEAVGLIIGGAWRAYHHTYIWNTCVCAHVKLTRNPTPSRDILQDRSTVWTKQHARAPLFHRRNVALRKRDRPILRTVRATKPSFIRFRPRSFPARPSRTPQTRGLARRSDVGTSRMSDKMAKDGDCRLCSTGKSVILIDDSIRDKIVECYKITVIPPLVSNLTFGATWAMVNSCTHCASCLIPVHPFLSIRRTLTFSCSVFSSGALIVVLKNVFSCYFDYENIDVCYVFFRCAEMMDYHKKYACVVKYRFARFIHRWGHVTIDKPNC